jgi:hypothetical protein
VTDKMKSKNNSCLLQTLAITISTIVSWYLMKFILLWVPNLADLLDRIQTPLKESTLWQNVGMTVMIGVAVGLYQVKRKLKIVFALIEISGGFWTIWATFTQSFENSVIYALALA